MCAFTQRARAAGMAQSDFGQALAGAERRMERAAVELARTRRLLEREDMAGAFGSAFAFSAEVEKLALLARVLPAYTGHPKAAELTEQMLLDTDLPVINISYELSYGETNYFSKAFKRKVGVTPTEFRESGKRAGVQSSVR